VTGAARIDDAARDHVSFVRVPPSARSADARRAVAARITVAALQQMKRDGRKIAGVVCYDYQMAQIVDRAGVDIVSVGDSVGTRMFGQEHDLEVTLDQMILACRAVRRGVVNAVVSCDFPYGPLQEGVGPALSAAVRIVKEGGADMVKLDGAAQHPDAVRAIARAGIPVWAQFGITPHTALRYGGLGKAGAELAASMTDQLLAEARLLEEAGAAMLDFTNSGPVAGPAIVPRIEIPVIGGLGGGPWLDGRVRAVANAIGYLASAADDGVERYANVAKVALDAFTAYVDDVRNGRQVRGEKK
jgi:3-methyl-2-oxobutanoate hydroxymethyltransferase